MNHLARTAIAGRTRPTAGERERRGWIQIVIRRRGQQDLVTTQGLDQVTVTGDDSIQPATEDYKDVREASGFGGRCAVGLIGILPQLADES